MSPPDEWTPNLLKELFAQRFESQDRAVGAALAAQEKAVSAALIAAERAVLKAEAAGEKRFESVNEFRAVLSDQQRLLLPRSEATAEFNSIREKIDTLNSKLDLIAKYQERSEGKGVGMSSAWGWLLGVVGLVGGLVSLFFALAK